MAAWAPSTHIRRPIGFTVVELLVVIGAIAVILAIALPALRGAREAARSAACQARLGQIGAMYALYANDHDGAWPTLFTAEVDSVRGHWGGNPFRVSPVHQIDFWAFPLRAYSGVAPQAPDEHRDDIDLDVFPASIAEEEVFSCPAVLREAQGYYRERFPGEAFPAHLSSNSYLHSVALFTRPGAWRTDAPIPDANAEHELVRHAQVVFPAQKAVLAEFFAFHTSRQESILRRSGSPVSLLAADGHVERRATRDGADPSPFTSSAPSPFDGDGVWFVSTRDGAQGRDW